MKSNTVTSQKKLQLNKLKSSCSSSSSMGFEMSGKGKSFKEDEEKKVVDLIGNDFTFADRYGNVVQDWTSDMDQYMSEGSEDIDNAQKFFKRQQQLEEEFALDDSDYDDEDFEMPSLTLTKNTGAQLNLTKEKGGLSLNKSNQMPSLQRQARPAPQVIEDLQLERGYGAIYMPTQQKVLYA